MDTMTSSQSQSNISDDSFRDLLVLGNGEKLDENLLCTICQQLVMNPQECEDCQNLFCSKCIKDWITRRNACPLNCPSNPVKLKQPHRFVKNALGALKFKCSNNQNGCVSVIALESINNHLKSCQFESVKCKNEPCQFIGLRSGLENHYLVCDYEEAKCQKCGFSLLRSTIGLHNCVQELTKRVSILENENNQNKEIIQQAITKILQLEKTILDMKANDRQPNLFQQNQGPPQQYYCPKNHPLTWSQGNYGPCAGCKKLQQVLRYICLGCRVGYCQACKVPIIRNNQCPNGHKLEQLPKVPESLLCDLCGCRPALVGRGDFRDAQCDFDICSECYKKIN